MAGTIEVTIDMYSGRPNPRIDLTDQELDELKRRLSAAQQAPSVDYRDPPQLGYRGFRIINPKQEPGLPYQARTFEGIVVVAASPPSPNERQPPRPRAYRDTGDLEKWLLDRAADRGLARDIVEMGGPRHP
jgi:hypothetical protein